MRGAVDRVEAPSAVRGRAPRATRRLEVGVEGRPIAERLVIAAERVAAGAPAVASRYALRADQHRVFARFAEVLLDLATDAGGEVSRFCRIVLPPRTGKTVIAGHIIAATGLVSVVAVPTKALVQQTARALRAQLPGVPVGVFCSDERRVVRGGVCVITYASLVRHAEAGTLPGAFGAAALVFVDEAHRAMTRRRMRALRGAFGADAVRVALTATPDYDAVRRLEGCFPRLVDRVELCDAMALGLLAPARVWMAEVDTDGSRVELVAGDYDREALRRALSSAPTFAAARHFRYVGAHAQMGCLVACSTRRQASDLHAYLIRHRPAGAPRPALILGETPAAERDAALSGFERGAVDTLVQVGVLIEGWSAPRCKLLIDLAPTTSRVRATQKYFRVMTRWQGREARLVVLLPRGLSTPPVLPTDVFLPPSAHYRPGDRLGERQPRRAVEALACPVRQVRLVSRVLATGALRAPTVDRRDRVTLRAVVVSCADFDPADLPGVMAFRALVFSHPAFMGSGAALLQHLGVPAHTAEYERLLMALFPAAWADRLLSGGRVRRRASVAVEWAPIEAAAGVAWPGPDAEALRARVELRAQLDGLIETIRWPRTRRAVRLRFGWGAEGPMTYDEVGARLTVTHKRAHQLVQRGLRELRRSVYVEEAQRHRRGEADDAWLSRLARHRARVEAGRVRVALDRAEPVRHDGACTLDPG